MHRLALLAVTLLAAGCSGSDKAMDPIERVPAEGGLREKVADAQKVTAADFPAAQGTHFDDLAAQLGARDGEAALATSVFVPGRNRLAFGTIDANGVFSYGRSAIYVEEAGKLLGPFPAPADLLMTAPQYRSKQAASEEDPFAAIYAAEFELERTGEHRILTVTRSGDQTVAATGAINVVSGKADKIPAVGERMPALETDTIETVRGDAGLLDTREPPSNMHERSLDDVLGKRPVALIIATPQFCQSRVCGPVVDVMLEHSDHYGDQMEFIHQEVFKDNNPNLGLRSPLVKLNLVTEPWLFVVGRDGRITARLEGSFGLDAVETALKTAL